MDSQGDRHHLRAGCPPATGVTAEGPMTGRRVPVKPYRGTAAIVAMLQRKHDPTSVSAVRYVDSALFMLSYRNGVVRQLTQSFSFGVVTIWRNHKPRKQAILLRYGRLVPDAAAVRHAKNSRFRV